MSTQPTKISELPVAQKVVVAVLMIASLTNAMGAAAVAPALPLMSEAFPAVPYTVIAWVITLPNLAMAAFAFLSGAIADKVGKVRTLIAASVIFTLGGVAAVFMSSIEPILVCRVFVGVGIAGLSVSTTALISELFHGHMRISVLSLQSAFSGIGIFLLEIGGGALASFGWRIPFLIYLIGVPIFLGAVFFLRKAVRGIAAQQDDEKASQAVSATPSFDRKEVAITIVLAALTIFTMQFCVFLFPGKVPYYVLELGGTSFLSGLFLGANGVSLTICSLLEGKLIKRTRRRNILILGFGMLVLCFFGWCFTYSLPATFLFIVIGGGGVGFLMPVSVQWISRVATPQTSGKIMGVYTTAFNLAAFVSSLVVGPINDAAGSISALFGVYGAILLVFAIVMLVVARKHID